MNLIFVMLVIFEQLLRKLFNVNVNVQDYNFTLNKKKFVKLTTLVSCENGILVFIITVRQL